MNRAWALALALAACGARPTPPIAGPTTGPIESSVGGVRVISAHRTTAGHTALGVFVRAPEPDAAVRATAALVIEARGAGAWRVRATPDGLGIRATAESASLAEALATIARALEVRDPTEAELESASDHLRRRRMALASDETALATRLALGALGGGDLDPFGATSDEVTSAAVGAWLREHLGAERALVVVVGDASEGAVRAAIGDAFAGAPHVTPPAETSFGWAHGEARAATSSRSIAAAATTAPTVEEAARIADWIVRLVPEAEATSFPLHGRAVVSATLVGEEAALRRLAAAIDHARTLDDEAARPFARDAEAELLAIGDAWLARPESTRDDALGLALVRASDGDAPPTTEAALDALASVPSTTTARVDALRADDVLPNGMRVRVARTDGDAAAVSLAFAAGAALDPAREHGRARLLATVVARSCEPDADLQWIDDASFGVVLRGDRATLERTAMRAIDCARRARTEIAHTEGVRAAAIADLDFGDRARAWAASVLAPGAPGWIAPRGSGAGLAAATQLDDALDDALDPRRATLSIAADEDPERLLAIAAAVGSVLSPRTEPLATISRTPEGPIESFETDAHVDAPVAIVALRSDAGSSERGARFVAHALASQLGARGLPVRAFFGGAARGTSFAVVAVTGTDERLDALTTITRDAMSLVRIDDSLAEDDARAERERALSLAAPEALARSLVTEASESPALDVARALTHAAPHFVLVRPTPRSPPRH